MLQKEAFHLLDILYEKMLHSDRCTYVYMSVDVDTYKYCHTHFSVELNTSSTKYNIYEY